MQLRSVIVLSALMAWGCNDNKPVSAGSSVPEVKKKLTLSFAIGDSSINISDQFSVTFRSAKEDLHATVKGTEILLPQFSSDTSYTVEFRYKDYHLSFANLTRQMIFPGQDMEWKFGVEYPPYKKLGWRLKDLDDNARKKIKQLQYLSFNLLEHGDGIQLLNKIE